MAKGVCCRFFSLRLALICITVIDIVLGLGTIVGNSLYSKELDFKVLRRIEIFMSLVCIVLAMISIAAVIKKKAVYLKYYFYWKIIELVLIPVLQIADLV